MAQIKPYKEWNVESLPDRSCAVCGNPFTPRYKNKGFECSERCHKLVKYRETGHIPRSLEARKRDTLWMKEDRLQNHDKYLAMERASKNRVRKRMGEDAWKRQTKHYNLIDKYGITIEFYETMLDNQNNSCAICGRQPKSKRDFHVDHDHSTGTVRGILCNNCNQGMQAVDRFPDWCKKATEYVAKSGGN